MKVFSNRSRDLLGPLLKGVSRSFYLTLRVLPAEIRTQIGLAYLLARTSDTIADTHLISPDQRISTLKLFRKSVLESSNEVSLAELTVKFSHLADRKEADAEASLLMRVEDLLSLFQLQSVQDRKFIEQVFTTITDGQLLDLSRFSCASLERPVSLETFQELDDYTYSVAGCVGEFWTKLCLTHLSPPFQGDRDALLLNGIRFGKGLQLINILRDISRDLDEGRCYIPGNELTRLGLTPDSLRSCENRNLLAPAVQRLSELAMSHLTAGWNYTISLPQSWARVRLACAWPVLIGARTLRLINDAALVNASKPVKVSRHEVRKLLMRSVLLLPFPTLWNQQFPSSNP